MRVFYIMLREVYTMMPIISSFQIKLTYDQLVEVDEYWKVMQFTSRNEFARMAIRYYIEMHKPPKKVKPPPKINQNESFTAVS